MPAYLLLVALAALTAAGFFLGRKRAVSLADGDSRKLHSLPSYYGTNVALFVFVPSFLILAVWIVIQPIVVGMMISADLPESIYSDAGELSLIMSDVRRVADGLDVLEATGDLDSDQIAGLDAGAHDIRAMLADAGVAVGRDVGPEVLNAALGTRVMQSSGQWALALVLVVTSVLGLVLSLKRVNPDQRARNSVENFVLALLIGAASTAILTTFGIVFSLLFNTIEFLRIWPLPDFFFGLTWSPSFGGGSQLGLIPLLWGTIYISLIALLVAVPIGLFSAIYLSEYAGPKARSLIKPLLELLAGIPTIVYGLFALLIVGPALVSVFGVQDGLGWMRGGTAVMTAGLVMGVMLIPFVSSLSDDIINAVPQAMRDGSYGLGATQSETVRRVILPAALPGIVGAILLAASRAIGETMIVVMGAGAAARLSLNPFEAMTTVTAKIVSQLTGDADFSSPEALVAFALGMALFIITLALNVFALIIVRKYREQYE